MLNMESRMVIIFGACRPISLRHVFLLPVFGATPKHIPLSYRCLIKIVNQIRHVYLSGINYESIRNQNITYKIVSKALPNW